MTPQPRRRTGPNHRAGRALCLLATLAASACSMPSLHLIETSPPSFVQTDNVDAPAAGPGQDARTRRLYLGVVAGLRRQDKAGAALAFLDAYDRAYPGDRDAALLRADCLLTLGRPAEAAPIYRRLLSGPQEAPAASGLGQVAAAAGHWREAADDFGRAAALAPSNVGYLNNQGYALLRAGDPHGGAFVLRKATELAPGNVQARNNLALCLRSDAGTASASAMPAQQVATVAPADGRGR